MPNSEIYVRFSQPTFIVRTYAQFLSCAHLFQSALMMFIYGVMATLAPPSPSYQPFSLEKPQNKGSSDDEAVDDDTTESALVLAHDESIVPCTLSTDTSPRPRHSKISSFRRRFSFSGRHTPSSEAFAQAPKDKLFRKLSFGSLRSLRKSSVSSVSSDQTAPSVNLFTPPPLETIFSVPIDAAALESVPDISSENSRHVSAFKDASVNESVKSPRRKLSAWVKTAKMAFKARRPRSASV